MYILLLFLLSNTLSLPSVYHKLLAYNDCTEREDRINLFYKLGPLPGQCCEKGDKEMKWKTNSNAYNLCFSTYETWVFW